MTSSIASFGKWVRERRKERGLTQKTLGQMVGYAEVTMRQIEKDSYTLTRFVVECIVNCLADHHDDRDSIIRFAVDQYQSSRFSPQNATAYRLGMPFYGRETELAYLFKLLNAPECNCISIIGVGGVGKTRLALKALELLDYEFFQNTHFINLTNVTNVTLVPSLIAEVMGIPLSPFTTPFEQLIQVLQMKKVLLALDNFEQLMPDGIPLINSILERAPFAKLVITSRERLNLHNEWCIRLDGLDTSQQASTTSEASDLFITTAQKMDNRFAVTNINTITEICRIVQGIPLAIEMAASWTPIQSCEEILHSISQQMLELSTRKQGIEDRHKNLRSVFEATWNQLSIAEQSTLKTLSVFRGGFTAATAKTVAKCTSETLIFLQDKMLVQAQGNGRLVLHELIRQLALQKLSINEDELLQTKTRHAEFYVSMLMESTQRLKYHHTKAEVLRITPEVENLREMWDMLCETRNTSWFFKIWESLWLFFNITSRFREGEDLFTTLMAKTSLKDASEDETHMLSYSQVLCSLYRFRQGRIPDACDLLFAPELTQFRKSEDANDQYWIHLADSFIYHALGNASAALASTENALKSVEILGNEPYYLSGLYMQFGRIKHLLDDRFSAYKDLSEGVRILRESGCNWGIGLILTELGFVAEADNRLPEALNYYEAALANATELEDLWNYLRTQICIGRVTLALGSIREATEIQTITLEALVANPSIGFEIDCIVEIAQIFKHHGEIQLACAVLEYCATNPECFQPIRDRATAYMTAIRVESPNLDISVARNLLPAKKSELAIMLLKRLKRLKNHPL